MTNAVLPVQHISRFGVRLCTCEQERMHRLKDRAAPRKNASRRLPVPKPVVAAATTPVFAVAPQAHPDGSGASFRTQYRQNTRCRRAGPMSDREDSGSGGSDSDD